MQLREDRGIYDRRRVLIIKTGERGWSEGAKSLREEQRMR
jgi:hypothetical protein